MLRHQDVDAELVPMTTSGDRAGWPEHVDLLPDPVSMKGLWIDTILDALREGEVDLAVHSAKDLPADEDGAGELRGLVIGAVPERADPHDVLVFREREVLEKGMVVGTSSVRRRAQILAAFPGVGIADLRGNVDTRLRKLADGEVDVAVLAAAGLERLDVIPPHARTLGVDEMVPAPGQGCLAVQCRADDRVVRAALTTLDHRPSALALTAERALTRALDGGCALPLGAIAAVKGDAIRLAACVASADGARLLRAAAEGEDPATAARIVAAELRNQGSDAILAELREA
jgi:hydroxymethylbilane synthase